MRAARGWGPITTERADEGGGDGWRDLLAFSCVDLPRPPPSRRAGKGGGGGVDLRVPLHATVPSISPCWPSPGQCAAGPRRSLLQLRADGLRLVVPRPWPPPRRKRAAYTTSAKEEGARIRPPLSGAGKWRGRFAPAGSALGPRGAAAG
jgi:hypothetical protein